MARIVLINPRFETSYWGLEHALPLIGAKANLPVACLPLLAALTPPEHSIVLVDENVEPIDFEMCAKADIVGVTGMIVQRFRMTQVLTELKRRGCFVVVGGPWITVQESYFGDLADVAVIGEAEESWPRFLADWSEGRHAHRYEQADRTDMTTVPTPRFDLLRARDYAFGSLQISRGCPFTCEFCDIIVVFGRRPRLKTSGQVIAELEALAAAGVEMAFVVDDNLIGNKRAIKPVLAAIADWQRAHGYRMTFFTEASIDLADDAELLSLMVEANFQIVFIGIETPNEDALRETRKLQNVRKGLSMLEKVHAIHRAGLEVWCGMIVGFDSDAADIFRRQRDFIRDARIIHPMVGMLTAIPKTPLHARLKAEGRLDEGDPPAFGTNVVPLGMSRRELQDGYVALVEDLHEPNAYFDRLDALYLDAALAPGEAQLRYLRARPLRRLAFGVLRSGQAFALTLRLMRAVPDPRLRRIYRTRLARALWRRPSPSIMRIYALKCAMHFHAHVMVQQMRAGTAINSF